MTRKKSARPQSLEEYERRFVELRQKLDTGGPLTLDELARGAFAGKARRKKKGREAK
jgi:hypothetical protein